MANTTGFFLQLIINYCSEIAPTGHVSVQAPQEMQTSESMLYCVSPSEIADTGQPSEHAPQDKQESEIT